MNGNQMRSATSSAVSQISGTNECQPGDHASHEHSKRKRRGRRLNSATSDSRKSPATLGEHLSRNGLSRTSDAPNGLRSVPNSPFCPESRSAVTQGAYAGAKFGDSPSPRLLPPPPLHWISNGVLQTPIFGSCLSLTSELKTLLQVA